MKHRLLHTVMTITLLAVILLPLGPVYQVGASPPTQEPTPAPELRSGLAREQFRLAFWLHQDEKYDEAIEACWKAIEADPGYWMPYRGLAQAYIDKGNVEEGLQAFKAFQAQHPDNALALYGTAKLYLDAVEDGLDEAYRIFERMTRMAREGPAAALGYNGMGVILGIWEQQEEAMEMYRRAIEADPTLNLPVLNILSRWNSMYSDPQERIARGEELLAADPHGPLAPEAQYLIATGFANMGEPEKTIAEFRKLVTSYPDSPWADNAQFGIAWQYLLSEDFETGLIEAQKVIDLYPDSDLIASTYQMIYAAHTMLGNYELAEETRRVINLEYFYELRLVPGAIESLRTLADPSYSPEAEIAFMNEARLIGGGYYEEAISLLQQVLADSQARGDRINQAFALNNLGAVASDMGDHSRALEYYHRALQIAREIGYRNMEATILLNIGVVYVTLGAYEDALKFVTQAKTIANENQQYNVMAGADMNLGDIYDLYYGDEERALEAWEDAIDLLMARGMKITHAYIAITLSDIGRVFRDRGEHITAIEYYVKALNLYRELHLPAGRWVINDYASLVTSYLELGDYENALRYQQEALAASQTAGYRAGEASALVMLGDIYIEQQQFPQAVVEYERALEIFLALDDLEGVVDGYMGISVSYYWQDNRQKAIEYLDKALATAESIRGGLPTEKLKLSYLETQQRRYDSLIRVLYTEANVQPAESKRPWLERMFEVAERARSRALLDWLGNQRIDIWASADADLLQREADLRLQIIALRRRLDEEQPRPLDTQDPGIVESLQANLEAREEEYTLAWEQVQQTNPEYASLLSVQPLTVAEVQALLDDQTTLVEYFVSEEGFFAFIITRDSFDVVDRSLSRDGLTTRVTALHDHLRPGGNPAAEPEELAVLYDWLIKRIRPYLKTPVVGIIPHGVLHYIPFGALTDGERYLVEDYTLFYLPSASILRYLPVKEERASDRLLAFGNPQVEGVSSLRFAAREAETIAQLHRTQPYLGRQATESLFKAQAGEYSLIHLAAHGQFNPHNPLYSSLRLAAGDGEDGRLEVHEVYSLDLAQADLVTLSACQTQMGRLAGGDELIGLQRAFLYAGAPSVVASLWSVDDQATGVLMEHFYRNLRRGMGKAEALRQAQLATMEEYPNPYYWASFQLTGDYGDDVPIEPVDIGDVATWLPALLVPLILVWALGKWQG